MVRLVHAMVDVKGTRVKAMARFAVRFWQFMTFGRSQRRLGCAVKACVLPEQASLGERGSESPTTTGKSLKAREIEALAYSTLADAYDRNSFRRSS